MALGIKERGLAGGGALSVVVSVAVALIEIRRAISEVNSNIAQYSIHNVSDAIRAVLELGDAQFLGLIIYVPIMVGVLVLVLYCVVKLATPSTKRIPFDRTPREASVIIEVSTSVGARTVDLANPNTVAATLSEIKRTLRN